MQPTRRQFLKTTGAGLAALRGSAPAMGSALPRPSPAQQVWQDCELGLIFHFDMPIFAPGGWHAARKTFDPELYNPARLDTDQWIEAAKAAGARYAVFTATHFNGFLQWQSDLYPYGLKQARWRNGKGDIFADFVTSCRKAGIRPGVYLSCHRNAYCGVWDYRVNWGRGGDGQAAFARTGGRMVEELCSRYGPLVEIWFDAGLLAPSDGGPNVLPIVEKHQPSIVFYHSPQRRDHRWIGNEDGVAGDPCWATMPGLAASDRASHGALPDWRQLLAHGDPDGTRWAPAMVDVPIRNHEWFWRPQEDYKVWPLEKMLEMYYTSVGLNSNLIFGATPDRDGLIPKTDFRRYAEFGKEIRRRFGKPLAEVRDGKTEIALPRPARIDHIALMEDIRFGERVRGYVVEVLVPGNEWVALCKAQSIGHKRIHKFPAREVARVRFRCTNSVAEPKLAALAVYSTAV